MNTNFLKNDNREIVTYASIRQWIKKTFEVEVSYGTVINYCIQARLSMKKLVTKSPDCKITVDEKLNMIKTFLEKLQNEKVFVKGEGVKYWWCIDFASTAVFTAITPRSVAGKGRRSPKGKLLFDPYTDCIVLMNGIDGRQAPPLLYSSNPMFDPSIPENVEKVNKTCKKYGLNFKTIIFMGKDKPKHTAESKWIFADAIKQWISLEFWTKRVIEESIFFTDAGVSLKTVRMIF